MSAPKDTYQQAEEARYERRCEDLEKLDRKTLFEIFDQLRSDIHYLYRAELRLKRAEHKNLEGLYKNIQLLP